MPACVLDSTALDELGSPEWRRALLEAGYDLVVPTVVLAERFTGRPQDQRLRTALRATRRPELDEARAHAAGELRDKLAPTRRRAPSAVDAVVVAVADHAARRDGVLVLTSDVTDFEALRTQAANGRRIAIRRP
jgi:predicted nucleic acid-binding protein